MTLTRIQIALLTIATALLASFLACGVIVGKIAVDGAARNTPRLAFKNVGWALKQGNFLEAGKDCLAATLTMASYNLTNVMYQNCMKLYWDSKGY
jgi:hypothetical protein